MNISIVGGAGRVGLPLALVLAEKEFNVRIIDIDEERVNLINSRIMPFQELGAQEILSRLPNSRLIAHTELNFVRETEVCILIIGTPVSNSGIPTTNSLLDLVKELTPFLTEVKLLILRSTVFPGVTKEIKDFLLKQNIEIEIAFCPERLVEGNAIQELRDLPQIIGTDSERAYNLAYDIFNQVSSETLRTQFEEAEIVKLFSNAFRYSQFAIANEFFEICVDKNINWERVWFAMKHRYPRAASIPSPGFAAGPCLVKDTQQLNFYYENNFKIGGTSLAINENLPNFIVSKLAERIEISDKIIGILGMTFKGEIDDFRQSLAFPLKNYFESKAKKVLCSDSKLQDKYFVDTATLIEESDIIIIAAPHREYQTLITSKPIIDIWRITKNQSLF